MKRNLKKTALPTCYDLEVERCISEIELATAELCEGVSRARRLAAECFAVPAEFRVARPGLGARGERPGKS